MLKTYDMRILLMELILSIAKKDSKNSSYNFGYLKKSFQFSSLLIYIEMYVLVLSVSM